MSSSLVGDRKDIRPQNTTPSVPLLFLPSPLSLLLPEDMVGWCSRGCVERGRVKGETG